MKVIGVHMDRCTGCKTCELYCGAERGSEGKTLLKAVQETPAPQPRVRVEGGRDASFPLQCRHCLQAPCLDACLTGALARDRRERHGDHPGGSLHRVLDLHGLLSLRGDLPLAGAEDRDQVRSLPLHGEAGLRRCLSDEGPGAGRHRSNRRAASAKNAVKRRQAMSAEDDGGVTILDLGR